MIRSFLLALCAPALLVGCATATPKSAPICDGHHLRPANPYGSVLQPASLTGGTPPAPALAKPSKADKAPGAANVGPGGCG